MNIFDRIINAVAPVSGLKRAAARRALTVINSGYGNHGASQNKNSLRGWTADGGSATEDIQNNLAVLRQRNRDLYMGVLMYTHYL